MKKRLLMVALATIAVLVAKAQTNLQMFYDFGRQYVTPTFEMFKGDKWGDTFFFIDHYYTTSDQRTAGQGSAINGSYFEIERGLNFWQDSELKDLSLHVEYDGATWGTGIASIGAKYFFHNSNFNNTLSLYAMYDYNTGCPQADIPVKFSAVWGLQDLFGAKGLRFSGFADYWGNNSEFGNLFDLMNISKLEGDSLSIGRMGELEKPLTVSEFLELCEEKTGVSKGTGPH